jgi:hypothetical protein
VAYPTWRRPPGPTGQPLSLSPLHAHVHASTCAARWVLVSSDRPPSRVALGVTCMRGLECQFYLHNKPAPRSSQRRAVKLVASSNPRANSNLLATVEWAPGISIVPFLGFSLGAKTDLASSGAGRQAQSQQTHAVGCLPRSTQQARPAQFGLSGCISTSRETP